MRTWYFVVLPAAVALAALQMPAYGQSPIEESPPGEDSRFIVPDRPAPEDREDLRIGTEEETFTQIRGAWAANKAACATVEEDGNNGLYVTDTLIRWEDATCSIRDIDSEDGSATVSAFCATEDSRTSSNFRLLVTGEETLTLRFQTDEEEREVDLQRCAAGQ
ncbi:hypothetical protein [Chelativorans salis]|uniref:DUF3617 family protein n=1 Tax=Chelativorans salis TaxID=2978478 RepID=A0ABT2LPN4_9HYPH|nr:hypothetical protein [Chelativorans sp. EGI FJ00035]MCT7375154.1 hypothetical protein [Chelativorans sp. EGI FJ00035]